MTEGTWFFLLLTGSVLIVLSYQWGSKRNIKIIKKVSESLERAFRPSEKEYTIIGGIAGFRAEYRRKPFVKIILAFSLLPRQSILYLPFAMIRKRSDTLEMLFYLDRDIKEEAHIIRRYKRSYLMLGIKGMENLKKEELKREGIDFYLFSRGSNNKESELLKRLLSIFGPRKTVHISLTPENSVLYVKLNVSLSSLDEIERSIKKAIKRMER